MATLMTTRFLSYFGQITNSRNPKTVASASQPLHFSSLTICQPSSCFCHFFPLCDTSVSSRLRTATRFTFPIQGTKTIFFINNALNHYQVGIQGNYIGLEPPFTFFRSTWRVDLITLEGEMSVRQYTSVRTSVHKKFVRFQLNLVFT